MNSLIKFLKVARVKGGVQNFFLIYRNSDLDIYGLIKFFVCIN